MIDGVELAPDYRISRLIRGGWQQHAAADLDTEREVAHLHAFSDAGILAFETADTYRGLDAALARTLAERRAGGLPLPRIHTRITLPAEIGPALDRARARLGQDRLDLVQLQSWQLDEAAFVDAALRLQEAADAALIRHSGLMNVDVGTVDRVRAAGARPLTVQAQCSLLDRRALASLAPYAVAHGMHILAYGPLAGGFLTEGWLGRADPGMAPGAGGHFHREYRIVIEAFGGWALYQRLLGTLAEIAQRYAVRVSAVALRWVLDQPGIAAALVGASSPARLTDWRDVFSFSLDAEDRDRIAEVLANSRGPTGPVGGLERDSDGPFARAIATTRSAVDRVERAIACPESRASARLLPRRGRGTAEGGGGGGAG